MYRYLLILTFSLKGASSIWKMTDNGHFCNQYNYHLQVETFDQPLYEDWSKSSTSFSVTYFFLSMLQCLENWHGYTTCIHWTFTYTHRRNSNLVSWLDFCVILRWHQISTPQHLLKVLVFFSVCRKVPNM